MDGLHRPLFQAWRAHEDTLFLCLILHFEREVPKRLKQTGVAGKAGVIENKTSQGSRGRLGVCSLFSVGLSWTLGTFHSLTLRLIITICVVAGSHPCAGPASGVAGPGRGPHQLLPAAEAPRSFLEDRADVPTDCVLAVGGWLAFLSASSHHAVGCPGPALVFWPHVPLSSMPAICPHGKRAQSAPLLGGA